MDNKQLTELLPILLERCTSGDQEAFARLYELTAPKLYALAVSILGREDRAAETLQDSFISIWKHAGDYQTAKGAPVTWMASIVRHRALDVLRRTRRETPLDETMEQSLQAEGGFRLHGQLLHVWEGRGLLSCLDDLPARQRQSIILAYFYGLTHQEIAQYMGAPLGTVKSWIRRGLDSLRKHLSAEISADEEVIMAFGEKERDGAQTLETEANPENILVVDDDNSSRVVLSTLLRREGFAVQLAEDGPTALSILETEPFDMLFVDFLMPGMTGLEMASAVRKTHPVTPIILVTAKASMLEAQAIAQAGISQVLPKPFSREEILGCVRQYG